MGSHVFDILDFLFGRIGQISGFSINYGGHYPAEDVTGASFLFDSGTVGTATFNFNSDRWVDRIEIAGERGRIVFSCFDDAPVEVHTEASVQRLEFIPPDPIYYPFVQDMVKLIESGDKKGYAATAMRPTELIDTLLATYKK